MLKRHPIGALLFVWTCDLVGVAITILALRSVPELSPGDWVSVVLWTLVLCVAHLGGFKFVDSGVVAGWYAAIDVAAALVLPFPFFCLAIWVRFVATVVKRYRRGHPEPWLGPDFNSANVIIDAGAALVVAHLLTMLFGDSPLATALILLATAFTFAAVQILLTSALIALDERKPWHKAGSLDSDAILSDGMMVTAGALLAYIYGANPYLMLITLPLLLFLHKSLLRLNEAKLAYIDGKTGIYNYRYFDEALSEAFRKATTTRRPLALIFGDMDHLRDINNTHGHMVGDLAIAGVARVFKAHSGSEGVACRFGGEEFVLMLPGYTQEEAAEVAELVRRSVAATRVPLEHGGEVGLSISLGVAAFPEDADCMEALVKAADEAVYKAKHTGRNRVCSYEAEKVLALQS
ncbi:MAG: diguanylate cyclase [Bacillota bacterium]